MYYSKRLSLRKRDYTKKLMLILLTTILITSLLISSTAFAQEEELELPDPGITPDSPFYFLDNLGENIGLFLAFGPDAKAKKALEYAEERLGEAHAMAAVNKSRGVEQATERYSKLVVMAAEKAEEVREQGVSDNVSEIVASAISKHLSVLDSIKDKVPDQAKEAIADAKEASMKGMENALKALAKEKPERAIEINMAAIEGRLNRAKEKADGNDIEEVEDAINDAEKLFRFGEEISEIARGLGKDTSTVDQLVAKSTSVHLEVLAEVYEKVPEQAKPAIEDVMARSIAGHGRAVEALKARGALGGVPEELPIPETVPESVRERLSKIKPGAGKP
jgi:hypothetical protein